MDRRRFVASVGAVGVATTAGCLDDVWELVETATSFSAAPAIVSPATADEAGYDYRGTDEMVETEEFAEQPVEVTSYASRYVRTIETPLEALGEETGTETGVFGVLTTPQVTVGGETFNPVGEMSHAELAEAVQDRYDELEVDDGSIRRRTVDMLEFPITVDTFEGVARFDGDTSFDVFLDVSQPDYDGDHFVIVAVYPDDDLLEREDEASIVDTMVGGIEHGDDVDAAIDHADDATDE